MSGLHDSKVIFFPLILPSKINDIIIFLSLIMFSQKVEQGVPFVAQRLTNLTRIHEEVGSIPGLVQWVKDPALPCAMA